MVVGVIAGLTVDLLLQRGRRGVTRDLALAVTVPPVIAIVGCWLALGSFRAVAGYFRSSFELARGYSVAMSLSGPRVELVAALEATVLVAALLFLVKLQDRSGASTP